MNDNQKQINLGQAISWIVSVAVFFAGITFGVMGTTYKEQIKDNTERIRTIEVSIAVQQEQYRTVINLLTDLKTALKDHDQ